MIFTTSYGFRGKIYPFTALSLKSCAHIVYFVCKNNYGIYISFYNLDDKCLDEQIDI